MLSLRAPRAPLRGTSARRTVILRRGVAIGASVVVAGTFAAFASSAGAAPKPTVSQVQKSVNRLTSQEDQAAQMYDQSEQQLSNAKQRLTLVNRRSGPTRPSSSRCAARSRPSPRPPMRTAP